jgi:hypothetical protein
VSRAQPNLHLSDAELVLLSFTTTASSPAMMAALVIIATAGQMTGKMALYAAGHRGGSACWRWQVI